MEREINSWTDHLRAHGHFKESDIHELQSHLRDEIDDLRSAGLSEDESFLISVKRMGNLDAVSSEFAKVNTENLWKQLLVEPSDSTGKKRNRRDIAMVLVFSLLAGTLFKIPQIMNWNLTGWAEERYYATNFSLFILPFIAVFFLVKRNAALKTWAAILGVFTLSALVVNNYPSFEPHHTLWLSGLHLPMFLWLLVGVAYIGQGWRESRGRMNFIRFTGEAFIYGVLILAGVMVVGLIMMLIFSAIQIDLEIFFGEYYIIYGACAAALTSIYLVEAKKSVVENFAPILAKIFSPLFLAVMVSFLVVMVITGKSPFMERDFLIGFDLMLALVLGLVLYVISSRDHQQPANMFDYLNLALIVTALVIDGVALSAIIFRLTVFGITPNKLAALGENLFLLGNLAGLAWLYIGYFRRKLDFIRLEKWQTDYLYAYFLWTGIVAFLFPILFGFS
ncbi:MAG: permease prefix domain 1-containing protein [Syntrophomonadaceae bacterium]